MDSPEENGRRARRVRQMLKSFYGAANGKLEADMDPTSVDSMAFDIDQYFNEVLIIKTKINTLIPFFYYFSCSSSSFIPLCSSF
jgi:hypothetical protein